MKNLIISALVITSLINSINLGAETAYAQSRQPLAIRFETRNEIWSYQSEKSTQVHWLSTNAKSIEDFTSTPMTNEDSDNRMVFQSYRDGDYEIYAAYGDGSAPIRITHDSATSNISPKLKYGGVLVAHQAILDDVGSIRQILKDGSHYSELAAGSGSTSYIDLAWAPDGQKLAYAKRVGGLYNIFFAYYSFDQQALSAETCLTCGSNQNNLSPTWSPDGAQIAFVRVTPQQSTGSIWRMGENGQNLQKLSGELFYIDDLAWSPDGMHLAFDYAANQQTSQRLGLLSLNSTTVTEIYNSNNDLVDIWMGDWSPDGTWIYFSRLEYVVQNNQLYVKNSWIERIPIAGGLPQRLMGNTGFDLEPNLEKRDLIPPVSKIEPLVPYLRWNELPLPKLNISASDDGGSGIASDGDNPIQPAVLGYTVQYRKEQNGTWTDWYSTSQIPFFSLQPGVTYYFRSVAKDWEGNIESLSTKLDGDTQTTYYASDLTGRVTDNRSYPLAQATISGTKLLPTQSNAGGQYATQLLYTSTNAITFDKSGYLSQTALLAPLQITFGQYEDAKFEPFLIPADNRVLNHSFEIGNLSPASWTIGAHTLISQSRDAYAGSMALALDSLACGQLCGITPHSAPAPENHDLLMATDAAGQPHLMWSATLWRDITYSAFLSGTWTTPQKLPITVSGIEYIHSARFLFDSQNNLHFIWMQGPASPGAPAKLYYMRRNNQNVWSPPEVLLDSGSKAWLDIDPVTDELYVVYTACTFCWGTAANMTIHYRVLGVNAVWQPPVQLGTSSMRPDDSNGVLPQLAIGPDHIKHFVWQDQTGNISYRALSNTGALSPTEQLAETIGVGSSLRLVVDAMSTLHIVWMKSITSAQPIYYAYKPAGKNWSAAQTLNINSVALPQLVAGETGPVYLNTKTEKDATYRWTIFQLQPNQRWQQFSRSSIDTLSGYAVLDAKPRSKVFLAESVDVGTTIISWPVNLPIQPAYIEQQVVIPAQMHKPTLTLAYRLGSNASGLIRALISDTMTITSSVQQVLTGTITGTWNVAWADLSAWQGKTVSLRLVAEDSMGTPVLLDNVSVASWTTAVLTQVSPSHLPAKAPSTAILITGTNFIPTPIIKLNNQLVLNNVKWISDSQLQADLPAHLPVGIYDLWISNPNGTPSIARLAIQVGQQHYVPIMIRSN